MWITTGLLVSHALQKDTTKKFQLVDWLSKMWISRNTSILRPSEISIISNTSHKNRSMHFLICCSFPKPCPTLLPLVLKPTRLLYPQLSPKSWFTYIESMMLSNHLILCHLLLLPSVFPSIRVFFNESALCIRWPKYWNFSFSNNPNMICLIN